MTKNARQQLDDAHRQLEAVKVVVRQVITILNAEQALLAQKVVREAGRK